MARKKGTSELPAAEKAIAEKLDALKKQIEKQKDGKATDAQKKQREEWKSELGSLRFVRLANKRIPVALAKIAGIGALSGAGYVSTEPQRKAIIKALNDAVSAIERELSGTGEKVKAWELPKSEA